MSKIILKCSACVLNGELGNLAEVLPDGGIKVMRNHPGMNQYTIIHGKEFQVACGKCGNIAFYKYPKVLDNPLTREVILRKTFQFYGSFVSGTI